MVLCSLMEYYNEYHKNTKRKHHINFRKRLKKVVEVVEIRWMPLSYINFLNRISNQ